MGLKSALISPYAGWVASKVSNWRDQAVQAQYKVMYSLVRKAEGTAFADEHGFGSIHTYDDFKAQVPIRDYEELSPYIDRIIKGEQHVLWPGQPIYFAKTSGTTSGVKYIPITRDSIDNHFYTAQTALMLYMKETGRTSIMDGKMMFLSGSPELEVTGGIPTGRLSGIVNHQVPTYLKTNQVPSYETNCIDDWEEKVSRIADETIGQDLTLISGIPPWVQMYFDILVERTGRPIKDIFPNFEVFVYGGVNYEPYRAKLEQTIGKVIPSIETYPASEGFIAYQDSQNTEGLLLNVDSGIFFEFIPAGEIFNENPTRSNLEQVELGVNYALIINNNAGLWGYNIGDTVKFVSIAPYRLIVTGRIKHFISAFGEHVIGEEVERAIQEVAKDEGVEVVEFTVAPMINVQDGELPYHEWLIEFGNLPDSLDSFAARLDDKMVEMNIYYADLIEGKVLRPLRVRPLQSNAFIQFMKARGKLGGQNKVPRLGNDRMIANELEQFILKG